MKLSWIGNFGETEKIVVENNAYEARIVKKHNRSVGNVGSREVK